MGSCASKKNLKQMPKVEVTSPAPPTESNLIKSDNKLAPSTPIAKSLQIETHNESMISKRSSIRVTDKKLNLEKIKQGLFTIYTKLSQKVKDTENDFNDGQIIILQHNVSGIKKRTEIVLKYGNRSKNFIKKILEKKSMNNEYICPILDIYQDQECYYLLQDYCSGGSLGEIKDNLSEEQVSIVLMQMISAISYVHSHKMTHENLSIDSFSFLNHSKNLFCKLIDISPIFYKENIIESEPTQENYNKDIYKLGCIAYELLFQSKPKIIKIKSDVDQTEQKVLDLKFQINPTLKKALTQMICQESNQVINLESIKKSILRIINNKVQKESLIQPLYNLSQCKPRNYFHSIILSIMLNKYMPEDEVILKRIFNEADQDKDNFLTEPDLTRLYKSIVEYENIEVDVVQLLEKLDVNQSGKIDELEFITAAANIQELLQADYIETGFKYLQNQNGVISINSLKRYSNFDEKLLKSVLMNTRGHSKIKFWEFSELMKEIL